MEGGFRLGLLVSMVVLDGYGIHLHSRMNARWYNRERYPASIVFMKFHLALLVSIAVLDMASIHIHSKNARAFNRERYPASDCVHGISSGPTGQYGSAGWIWHSHSQQECARVQQR